MNKDTVPQNYSMSLALFDLAPVLLFGAACLLLWKMTGSILILAGGIISFVSGALKVLWKIIVVVREKNVWPLFVQMRIGMPAGLTAVLAGFIFSCFTRDMHAFWGAALRPLPILFFILSMAGMAAMIRCSSRLDPSEARANWIEQSCNTLAQGAFLACMLFIYQKIV
ncbi:MAG: hypothetical protein IIY63_00610 [Oscillospiraceae bacterium]|nr:hypothetical protein [Oscillospiraceae bacterium]